MEATEMSKDKTFAILTENPSWFPEAPRKAAVARFRLFTSTVDTDGQRIVERFQKNPVALEEEIYGIEARETRRPNNCLPRPIHLPDYVSWRWISTEIEKCADAPPCMNHTFWCTVTVTSSATSGGMGNLHKCRHLQPYHGTPIPAFICPLPSSGSGLTTGHYYQDFPRLNVVCHPLFYVDLSSPCCLLPL
ncbi:hypothetical protein TNCV_915311 [Trichonephila clavipes]|nr:hypothetical protein TNCV_915311 [Trichonephila clavipes]